MQKKEQAGTRLIQQAARLGAGVLLVGVVAVGGLSLGGDTLAVKSTALGASAAVATSAQPLTPVKPTLRPEPKPAPTPEAGDYSAAVYDYAAPVPVAAPVEDSWFSDAAFIGDSRTEGLVLYGKIKAGGSFAHRGLNVQSARTDRVIKMKDGSRKTVIDALKQGTYAKVYLSLGVNELGWYNNDRYYKNYATLIDQVRATQPNAQIYLQTLIPVTAAKSAASYINNPQILAYNKLIKKLAEEKSVFVADVWSAFVDKSGALPAKASSDGVHLTKTYYAKWLDYLKAHTVSTALA